MNQGLRFRSGIAGGVLLLAGAAGAAQQTFSLYWENDSRYIKPNSSSDRHYTNGTKLVYSTQPKWSWLERFSDSEVFSEAASVDPAVGFFFGQNMYTSNHADAPSLRSDKERVFAGWVYTGMFIQRRQAEMLDHIELNVGVVGPSARAHRTQHCVHTVLRSGRPVGWDEQIGDEPAADFTWVRHYRYAQGLPVLRDNTDVIADIGFTAGSLHRHIEAGIMLRCGMNVPDDFGPGRLSLPSSAASLDPQNKRSVYLFGRLSGRAVEHDRFLTGLTHRPWVGRAEVGAVFRHQDFEIAYAQTYITEEFKGQDRTDSYGALTVTWLF